MSEIIKVENRNQTISEEPSVIKQQSAKIDSGVATATLSLLNESQILNFTNENLDDVKSAKQILLSLQTLVIFFKQESRVLSKILL